MGFSFDEFDTNLVAALAALTLPHPLQASETRIGWELLVF
tara:strand:- start:328 stop:447 length:120 start_codon:yes stop_codon:yes gene_type:complete